MLLLLLLAGATLGRGQQHDVVVVVVDTLQQEELLLLFPPLLVSEPGAKARRPSPPPDPPPPQPPWRRLRVAQVLLDSRPPRPDLDLVLPAPPLLLPPGLLLALLLPGCPNPDSVGPWRPGGVPPLPAPREWAPPRLM